MPLPSSVPAVPAHKRPLAVGALTAFLLPPLRRAARSVVAHPANGARAARTGEALPAGRVPGAAPRCLR